MCFLEEVRPFPSVRREASTATASAAPAGGRDETARDVRGLMRVGNYASRTMVKGESIVELVLMCASESWGTVRMCVHVCMHLSVYVCTCVVCVCGGGGWVGGGGGGGGGGGCACGCVCMRACEYFSLRCESPSSVLCDCSSVVYYCVTPPLHVGGCKWLPCIALTCQG